MPKTNQTTVHKDNEGRYRTNVPKAFGDSLNLKNKKLDWKQTSGTAFKVKVIEE